MISGQYSRTGIAVVLAIAGWLAVVFMPGGWVRAAISLPLVLVLPGYALLRLMRQPLLNGPGGACFITGLSMAATIAAGFLLQAAGALNPIGWAKVLLAMTVVPLLISMRLSPERQDAAQSATNLDAKFAWPSSRPGRLRLAAVAAALAVLGAAGAVASHGVTAYREFKYTELWVVPDISGGNSSFFAGFRNMEGDTIRYDLELLIDGKLLAKWNAIALSDGEEWVKQSTVPYSLKSSLRAEARLFRQDDPTRLYRQAWINLSNK